MYLRHTTVRKHGKVQRYWRLVRSVRIGRRVIQQTVAHLGELDEGGRIEARSLAQHLIGTQDAHVQEISEQYLRGGQQHHQCQHGNEQYVLRKGDKPDQSLKRRRQMASRHRLM